MIKAELHCHSNHSDGLATVDQIIRKCRDLKIGAIAITDHNTFSGYSAAKRIVKKINQELIIIPGIEITCTSGRKKGHLVALGIEDIRLVPGEDVISVIDRVQDGGGIAIDAHPFGGLMRSSFTDHGIVKSFDAVEVLNGNTLSWQNEKAIQLAETLKKPKTAGSDAHTLGSLGKMACRVEAETVDSILHEIKKDRLILPEKNTSFGDVIGTRIRRKAKNYISRKYAR